MTDLYHRHFCEAGCGAYYVCSQPDGCERDEWTCPECIDDQLAADMNLTELQEMTRAENQ